MRINTKRYLKYLSVVAIIMGITAMASTEFPLIAFSLILATIYIYITSDKKQGSTT